MNVLLIGSGGREHALAWALSASPLLTKLYCAPGNPGIAQVAELAAIDITDHGAVISLCKAKNIDFVVVGPEAPLVAGLVDDLNTEGFKAFGPSKFAAQLEGSKGFTKDICANYNIPTAAYGRFTDLEKAKAYLASQGAPIVIKADGLAAGKGVTVAMTLPEAEAALQDIFSGRFGEAECVIEEFLEGEEASFFVLSDGVHTLPLATAQDHKRVGDGDVGLNTGGMGAYSPAPCMTEALCAEALEKIVKPTVKALADMGHPYVGVLYIGLMLTKDGPKVIEFNCRFGDPETQVILPLLESDLVEILQACLAGRLNEVKPVWRDASAVTIVMAAAGYPVEYDTGVMITKIEEAEQLGCLVFHAGTKLIHGRLVTAGGRVLAVTAVSKNLRDARSQAYRGVHTIHFNHAHYRKDIGRKAVSG